MNLFNRVLVLLQLIAAIILAPLLIFVFLFGRAGLRNFFQTTPLLSTDPAPNLAQVICVGILVLIFAFALLLLLLELQRAAPHRLRIQSVQGVELLMTAEAITQQLEYALDALTDVLRVRPQVRAAGKGQGVDVFVELWTTANVDVQAKTQQVQGVARTVLEDQLGLKVNKLQIKLDQMKAPTKRVAAPPSRATPPSASSNK